VGYHWDIHPYSWHWLRYRLGWFWLRNQTVILDDFQVDIGESIKVFPFLTQASYKMKAMPDTFLEVGRSANGVVYFEQDDSWGGCFPRIRDGRVRLKIRVQDAFGKMHTKKVWVESVSLDEARKYNKKFGGTLAELRQQYLNLGGHPIDVDMQTMSVKGDE